LTLTYDDIPRTSVLGRLRAAWKIVAIFAIVGVLVLATVRFIVFQSQSVVIEKVEFLCYAKLVKRRSLPFERMTATDLTADCKAVKTFVDKQRRNEGRYRRWHFVPGTYASFRYRSPVDDMVHQGRIKRDSNDDGRAIRVGDQIVIYASRFGAQS
jgi:hypothetical protein